MLQIGNAGQSFSEYKAQFMMWAIVAAPLTISTDLRTIDEENLATLLSREIIRVSQDSLGIQGQRIKVRST